MNYIYYTFIKQSNSVLDFCHLYFYIIIKTKCYILNCFTAIDNSTFIVSKNYNLKNQWENVLGIFIKSKF